MREVSFPATSRVRSVVADALWYPRLHVDGVDLLHCPSFRGPFAPDIPVVVTVHDLAVLREPGWFNRWTRAYSRFAVPRVVRAASRLIAVSEFTKRELVDLLGVEEAKIRVVPNAVEDVFTPEGPRAMIQRRWGPLRLVRRAPLRSATPAVARAEPLLGQARTAC